MLSPSLNSVHRGLRRIHLMGICGTGMASLAGMLKERGYLVTGSDKNVYPPMSDFLKSLEIPVLEGYSPEHLHPEPDLVIVGNVITRENPEAKELSRLGLPYLSFPQALRRFALKDRRSIVISGTHGKTTTASLTAWILEKADMDPGFMIGGIPLNFKRNFKTGTGDPFVVEGDEYDTAFFDKGPKFLHYNPWITVLTSVEFDHADIYRDLEHVRENFRRLIAITPGEGLLIANGDDSIVRQEIRGALCPVETYGFSKANLWRAVDWTSEGDLTRVEIAGKHGEKTSLATPVYGRHNLSNLMAALAVGRFLDIPWDVLREAAITFKGVRRRQEIVGEKRGILVIDDFAHHPTAVRETARAVRERYGGRRLITVFEPRSNSSRRNIFQREYARSFDSADLIFVPRPALTNQIPPEERFSSSRLASDLRKRGLEAYSFENTGLLLDALVREAKPGDVVLIMSNGGFDNLHKRLLDAL